MRKRVSLVSYQAGLSATEKSQRFELTYIATRGLCCMSATWRRIKLSWCGILISVLLFVKSYRRFFHDETHFYVGRMHTVPAHNLFLTLALKLNTFKIDYICFTKITTDTVNPVLSDQQHDIFWLFRQVVAYCCMKVVQIAHAFLHYFHPAISNHLSIAISMSPEWMVA